METILSNRGYLIPKKDLKDKEIREIKKELTVKPKETPYTCVFVDYSFPVFVEDSTYIGVPRFWGLNRFGPPKKDRLLRGTEKLKEGLVLTSKPRDYQVDAIKNTLDKLKETGGCTLQVACGYGKTYSSLYIAMKLGFKTIIIAPRVKIVNQWVSEIKRFIPGARVGIVQGAIKETKDVDFCVATLQTIGLKDFTSDDFKEFAYAIYDELPFFAADKMSTVLWKVYSKYNLGLSADPSRADGLDKVFAWYLGPSVVKSEKPIKRRFTPRVHIIYPKEKFFDKRIQSTGNINLAGMINDLVNSDERFSFVLNEINKLLEDDKRRILVMADRREYLKMMHKSIQEKHKDKECLLYLGGLNKKKLREIDEDLIEEKYHIIFATYSLIGVGVSIDYLNTAVFATPKKDKMTEQASGRIMRKDHDLEPLIIDIVDNNGIFKNQARTRRRFYEKKKWNIKSFSYDLKAMREKKKNSEEEEQKRIKQLKKKETKSFLNLI